MSYSINLQSSPQLGGLEYYYFTVTSSTPVLAATALTVTISGEGANPADIFSDFVFDDPSFPSLFSSITIPAGQTSAVFYFHTSQPAALGVGKEFIVEIGGVDPAEIDVGSVVLAIIDDSVLDFSDSATGLKYDFDGNPSTVASANRLVITIDDAGGQVSVFGEENGGGAVN